MNPYPNPCQNCKQQPDCTCYRTCARWLKYFRTIWKQFNSYPARIYRRVKNMKREKFIYEHPDLTRKHIQNGPCAKCPRSEDCEVPCVSYWIWWDIRMEWFRRRFGCEQAR